MKKGKWISCEEALPGTHYLVDDVNYDDVEQIAFIVDDKVHCGHFVIHCLFAGFVDHAMYKEDDEENGIFSIYEVDKWMKIPNPSSDD